MTIKTALFLERVVFFALFFFASVFINLETFAKVGIARRAENNYCNLVSRGEIFAEVKLRQGATDSELNAAIFLANSLKKICDKSNVYVVSYNSPRTKATRVSLNLKKDFSDKNHFRREKIFIDISKNEIEIAYSAVDDVWTAVGIFLDEYCDIRFFAPLPLGEEIVKHTSLRLKRSKREIVLPFIERAIFSEDNRVLLFELINGQKRPFWFNGHNLPHLLPQKIRDRYPDWYAICNGKRKPTRFAQLDFLNQDARDYIFNLSKNYFYENPVKKIFSLCYSDNGGFDTTEKTLRHVRGFNKRGYNDYSNVIFAFTNDIAKRLAKVYPQKFVSQGAYMRTETPPDFKIEKNVAIVLCTDKSNWYIPSEREIDKKLIKDWRNSGAGLLCVHDYNYGFGHWIPRETTEYIAESIAYYNDADFKSYVAETYPIWAYDTHKIWITSTLLKNTKLEYKSLKKQFFDEYYKEASVYVKDFFNLPENAWKNRKDSPALWLKLLKRPAQLEMLSDSDINYMENAISNAEKVARSRVVRDRVKEIRLVFDLTKTAHRIYFYSKKLWSADTRKSNATEILNTIEALKTARILFDIQFKRQAFETKYPKSNFQFWELIDMLNPSEMKARELLALNEPKISDQIERIFGKEFLENAKLSDEKNNNNLLKNPSFENELKDWNVSGAVTCKETHKADKDAARSGKFGLKLSSIDYISVAQRIKIKENGVYTFKCFGKGKIDIGATYYMRLTFLQNKSSNKKNSVHYLQIPSGNFDDFKKFEITAKAPEGAIIAECAFFSVNASDEYPIHLDDFSFQENR